jgi:hypothetical protein
VGTSHKLVQPNAETRRLFVPARHKRSGTVHQQPSQVAVSAFTDHEQLLLASGSFRYVLLPCAAEFANRLRAPD